MPAFRRWPSGAFEHLRSAFVAQEPAPLARMRESTLCGVARAGSCLALGLDIVSPGARAPRGLLLGKLGGALECLGGALQRRDQLRRGGKLLGLGGVGPLLLRPLSASMSVPVRGHPEAMIAHRRWTCE